VSVVEHGPQRITALTMWAADDGGPLLVAPVPIGQRPIVIEVPVPGDCTVVLTTETGAIADSLPPFRMVSGSRLTVTLGDGGRT